ncbi:MAG: hypothetical protein M0P95_13280 [Sulfuritalea sp.]|nr:hypothetical protein [Sulfuritalea sp.]
MTPTARHVGILCIAFAAGCASVKEAPPVVLAQPGPLQVAPSLVAPGPHSIVAAEPPGIAAKEKSNVAPIRTDISQSTDKVARPSAKPLAKLPAAAVAAEQVPKNVTPAPVAKTLEPPLDVAALKLRLRDTNAIGVLTKLALKNQVDDLLKQFRSRYLTGQKTSVANLRQPYDLLVLKVLTLIQDGDPPLARTISGSREAIWGILADPEQFKLVS